MTDREISCSSSNRENVALSQQTFRTHRLTWQIPYFNVLPLAEDFNVDSEHLVFQTTRWRIQTYPNVMIGNDSEACIYVVMRRTSTLAPAHKILCQFGVMDNNGLEYVLAQCILTKDGLEMGPIKLLALSEACKIENNLLQNGIITMVCRMTYIEGTHSDEFEIGEIYEVPPSVYDEDEIVGFLSTELQFDQKVTWKLDHFTAMPMTVGYFVVSPTFEFESTSCCLRLYPNGRSEDNTEGSICIELELSDFLGRKQETLCEIRIKDTPEKIIAKRFLREDERVFGPFLLLKRSDVNKSFLKGDSITVMCKIFALTPVEVV